MVAEKEPVEGDLPVAADKERPPRWRRRGNFRACVSGWILGERLARPTGSWGTAGRPGAAC